MDKTLRLNCWQFKNCGREHGGLLADVLGECPVSTLMKFDGLNEGVGAGRVCWRVTESACRTDASRSGRPHSCHTCEFYRRVLFEQEDETQFRYSDSSCDPCPASTDPES